MKIAYSVGIGPIKLEFTHDELTSLARRFRKNSIYDEPCMILNRANGLALDAGPDGKVGAHNILWSAHAGPWQQWRLKRAGDGVEIVSESNGLWLTTMSQGIRWGETWLDNKVYHDWSRSWKLRSSEDRVAFAIENASSGFILDAGREPDKDNKYDPHVWPDNNWDPWQQWIILRLPLA